MPERSDLVQSCLKLQPARVLIERGRGTERTLVESTISEMNNDLLVLLHDSTRLVNKIIMDNLSASLPLSKKNLKSGDVRGVFSSPSSRDAWSVPCIERFALLDACLLEAGVKVQAYQRRMILWRASRDANDPRVVQEECRRDGVTIRLVEARQALAWARPPRPGNVRYGKLNYANAQDRACRGIEYVPGEGIWLRGLAGSSHRWHVLLAAPDLALSYPFMAKITRPVLEEESNGNVSFRVAIMEDVPMIEPVHGRVTAFDLGMDSVSVFTGVELDAHGRRASRIIKPSRQLARMSARRERLLVEKTRLIMALRREIASDPWSGKAARLRLNLNAVKARVNNLADAIDWRAAVEMVSWACRSGGVLVLEDLRWSGGGPVKFRHGGVARRVEHVAARLGVRVLYVNPAYSSRTCPSCGTRIPGGCDANRVLSCSKCGHKEDKDSSAAVILAKRGLNKSDGTRVRRPGRRTKRDGTGWSRQQARRADSRMIKLSLERRRRLLAGACWYDDGAASRPPVVTLRGAGSQSCSSRGDRGTIITTSG